jgi:hypothetical protein
MFAMETQLRIPERAVYDTIFQKPPKTNGHQKKICCDGVRYFHREEGFSAALMNLLNSYTL